MSSAKSFLFLFVLFSIASCSVYAPNTINAPMLKKKGELQIGAHAGNGLNLQAAYAASDHIGIMLNYMNIKNEVTTNEIVRDGGGSLLEAGLGYFSRFSDNNHFELFGGYGAGKVNITRENTLLKQTRNFDANASRFFVQPGIGMAGKIFEVNLSSRVSFLKYNKLSTTYTADDLKADSFVNIDGRTWIFLEPALTIRVGFPRFKFQAQVGRSFKLTKDDLGYEKSLLGFGIVARI